MRTDGQGSVGPEAVGRESCRPARVSIVVPCYNERDNVRPMVDALDHALAGRAWEVIFVDDSSPDGTIDVVRDLAAQDARVRGILRLGRRGLSSAVIEGILSSSAGIVAVMDGDMQHDERCLGQLLDAIETGGNDIAIGSRHVAGGDAGGLANRWRRMLSDAGIRVARRFMPVKVSDPMSGFFAIRRTLFTATAPHLSGTGFKILLDILMSAPVPLRVAEIPFVFRSRAAGESKLDSVVLIQFAAMMLDRLCRGYLPVRFISFCFVGLLGIGVNLGVLSVLLECGADFSLGQVVGTYVSMIVNFWLNNRLTYRDCRLKGAALVRGLCLFVLICSIGALANVGVAQMILSSGPRHWTSASVAGAAIAAVWNYAVSSTLIWKIR
ncbi:glycosyltransferase family 2 protein [Gluconacetobacter entanii]|uniref:Glycosyltransferase family 2 protein n=1 Tax=Gluconacetobacter entanii TaxID=108528 RepID=A0ABT3K3Y6_9PROT|nr:glycosyltransferase family 2 protein [Gluconacetobacter entanii]MCW4590131.1 glycosyltransferase family 2 protein [Gluconacetobacter entanii]MCW4593266.1 glycosyltransferase family 2 protein [Gluconacetobacter entanii]NPC88261.1 glycosyltransferase family 2 protein [Gluconacetobacter entanii]